MPHAACSIVLRAMATRWNLRIAGDDAELLDDVAAELPSEVERWERILSRLHPSSELRRLNQAPVDRPLRIGAELTAAIAFCRAGTRATNGYFDPTAMAGMTPHQGPMWKLDEEARLFTWLVPNARLDLGGFGKGYTLDRLSEWLRERGITAALLDAGSSSLLAWGETPELEGWPIALLDPGTPRNDEADDIAANPASIAMHLRDAALSYSATRPFNPGRPLQDPTIDPRTGVALSAGEGCVVVCATAAWAEILSTAALCMGETLAANYIKSSSPCVCRLTWLVAGNPVERTYESGANL